MEEKFQNNLFNKCIILIFNVKYMSQTTWPAQGQTINQIDYLQVLVREQVCKK